MPSKGWDKIVGAIRPNRNLPDFLMDVKLTCTGKSPSGTPFGKDFPTILANLTAVANIPARFSNKKGLFVEGSPDRKIKFRHVLFEVSINYHAS